jgi:hypothetical protein
LILSGRNNSETIVTQVHHKIPINTSAIEEPENDGAESVSQSSRFTNELPEIITTKKPRKRLVGRGGVTWA